MMEELIGLIKELRYFVKMANAWMERDLGKEGISLPGELPLSQGDNKDAHIGEPEVRAPFAKAPAKARAKKTAVATPVGKTGIAITAPEDPFADVEPKAATASKVSPEDEVEARRRCQDVMGLFIRRYLKATPPGLDRAKSILTEVCGRHVAKIEDLTYAENLKLIPRYEQELETASNG